MSLEDRCGLGFSSVQLSGGAASGIPSVSYAYDPTNTASLGADATFSYFAANVGGEVTPFLVQPEPAAPTVTCSPLTIDLFGYNTSPQSLRCPIAGTSLTAGLYTLSFSQYSSVFISSDAAGNAVFTKAPEPNTLTNLGFDSTYSFVNAVPPATTTTITPVLSTTTTITSGISEAAPTSTVNVPKTVVTVTVYSSTIIKHTTTHTTLTGLSTIVTKTATCTMMKCNQDNCYRAMSNKPASASSFCNLYTMTSSLATPTYLTQCSGVASRVSSACSCFVPPTAKPVPRDVVAYSPPDYTFTSDIPTSTVTETDPPVTVTSGPYPSGTTTDPNLTISSGTSTKISTLKAVTTTTIVSISTVDKRTTSTSTLLPTTCF